MIGIIDTGGAFAAKVNDLVVHLGEDGKELSLGLEAAMIARNGNLHVRSLSEAF
jgi:hypothetical protein